MAYHDHCELSFTHCRPNELLSLHVPNIRRPQQLYLFVHCSSVLRKLFFNPHPKEHEHNWKQIRKLNKKRLMNERIYQVIKLCELLWLASNAEKEWLISSLSSHVRRALQASLLVFISNILAFFYPDLHMKKGDTEALKMVSSHFLFTDMAWEVAYITEGLGCDVMEYILT